MVIFRFLCSYTECHRMTGWDDRRTYLGLRQSLQSFVLADVERLRALELGLYRERMSPRKKYRRIFTYLADVRRGALEVVFLESIDIRHVILETA